MRFYKETIDEMAAEKSVARQRVSETILAVLLLAERYRNGKGEFSFSEYPELDDEVNRLLIELSDGLLKDAEERAKRILSMLNLDEEADAIIEESENGKDGVLWALDMHSSNLKRLLEAWIIIMFASGLTVNETLTKALAYMSAPESSPLWRESIRKRLIDPNEVRFGKGYQRNVINAFSVLLQTLIYSIFLTGTITKGTKDGAIGYRTFRQSNYDCPLCDSLTERVWPIDTMVLPAHPRCVCGIELVYQKQQ